MIADFKLWESSHEEQVKKIIDDYRDQAKDLGFNISVNYNQESGHVKLGISMIELSTTKTLSAETPEAIEILKYNPVLKCFLQLANYLDKEWSDFYKEGLISDTMGTIIDKRMIDIIREKKTGNHVSTYRSAKDKSGRFLNALASTCKEKLPRIKGSKVIEYTTQGDNTNVFVVKFPVSSVFDFDFIHVTDSTYMSEIMKIFKSIMEEVRKKPLVVAKKFGL
jgi:hypothetical protein